MYNIGEFAMTKITVALPDGSMRGKIDGYFVGAGLPLTVVDERLSLASVDVDWIGDVNHQKPQEIPEYCQYHTRIWNRSFAHKTFSARLTLLPKDLTFC